MGESPLSAGQCFAGILCVGQSSGEQVDLVSKYLLLPGALVDVEVVDRVAAHHGHTSWRFWVRQDLLEQVARRDWFGRRVGYG